MRFWGRGGRGPGAPQRGAQPPTHCDKRSRAPQREQFEEDGYDSHTLIQIAAVARMRIADGRRREEVVRQRQASVAWAKLQVRSPLQMHPRAAHTHPFRLRTQRPWPQPRLPASLRPPPTS